MTDWDEVGFKQQLGAVMFNIDFLLPIAWYGTKLSEINQYQYMFLWF